MIYSDYSTFKTAIESCGITAAEAEFTFNADAFSGAKLELIVDVQLEGRHSYGCVKVVL